MDQINWVLVFLVMNFAVTLFNSISSRHKVAQDELQAVKAGLKQEVDLLAAKLGGHSERIAAIEIKMDETPTHDHLAEIYKEMREISKSVSVVGNGLATTTAKLEAAVDLLTRMDKFWRTKNGD